MGRCGRERMVVVLDTTLCQLLAASQWFSPGTPVSSTNKTDRHDIPVAEILMKMTLNTITPNPLISLYC
jgi:hypothetical protein